ncbi:hypothetical protein BY458DRAFT_513324 [Sporodiniella umbellata]|nr:hypothetical protein BY458DRAFT_513324 [Sporodiniella umbellata]
MSNGGNIKVVVRCRPLNSRELARGAQCLIRMEGDQTIITRPPDHKANSKDTEDVKAFTFDKSYWSFDKNDSKYADQETVYSDLGVDLLNHAFDGYNCCIFAYGQTGAGKSYSMMGYGEEKGIIPMTCSELFDRISDSHDLTYRVEVSYIEIYNEKVHDLLNPKNKGNLKVREHPSTGPYVEDLSRLVVKSFDDINHLMDEGNKARTVAATQMNETSSRSHAVFTVFLTQIRVDPDTLQPTEKVARISLVDLAGSERANSTGATGARLKEGANINRSLTTLGKVISGLADQSQAKGKKAKEAFIPYRDSVLTWLLKDSLGGNSKTAMIAAISPADYDETLSTLRYADQAKKIQNKAVINEDPNAKMIRELKDELNELRVRLIKHAPDIVNELNANSAFKLENPRAPTPSISNAHQLLVLKDSQGKERQMTKQQVVEQLQSSEKLLNSLRESWEERLEKTKRIHREREQSLRDLGITIDKSNPGLYTPKNMPFIINLNEDPLMCECLIYHIKPGKTRVGRYDGHCEIRLSGPDIQDDHCWFDYADNYVTLHPHPDAVTMVNGVRIQEPKRLRTGYRLILGHHSIFRFNHPEEARKERTDRLRASTPCTERTDSPVLDDEISEPWNYARLEAMKNYYSAETNLDGLKDEEIERLYDGIARVRLQRTQGRTEDDMDSIDKRFSTAATMVDDISVCTESTARTCSGTIQERLKDIEEQHKKELAHQRSEFLAKIHNITSPSQKQLQISQRVITHWRQLRYVAMAEMVLVHAVMLKEANVISCELKKNVIYQFAIIEESSAHLKSHWEEGACLRQFESGQDEALINAVKPCVGIRVIDRKNQVVYFWSLEKLKIRLEKMTKLRNFIDRPQYRKHLNLEDPFYEAPQPKYSFVGSASVSVRNLVDHQAYESCVEILCRMTGHVKGRLRLLVSPIARSGTEDQRQVLAVGQQLLFEIRLLELIGIHESEFTQVHVQFRLSSFGGIPPYSEAEKLFATPPVSQFTTTIRLDYSQTMSILITEPIQDILMHKMIPFEVYGLAQTRAISQYERWDDQREKPRLDEMLADGPKRLTEPLIQERRPEEELISAERLDVLAWIQILETVPNGSYKPVQVMTQTPLDRGVFLLRQGLQRKIVITLSHTSGRQFVWNRVANASIGHVRLLDGKGRILPSPTHEDVPVRFPKIQDVEYKQNGVSTLHCEAPWDSSQHVCRYLNQLSAPNTRVILNLRWEIEAEKCLKPIQCSMDISVKVQGREANGFNLFRLLSSTTRYLTKCSGVFLVHLRPPMTRRVSQLWRLNTVAKYVPGEEFLGSWRPRGVSLINDFKKIQERIDRKEQVSRTSQTLMLHTARSQTSHRSMNTVRSESGESQVELIKKVLLIWKQKWGTDKEIALSQDPPIPGMQETEKDLGTFSKLISEVKFITEIDNVTKKGYLMYQEDPAKGTWTKKYMVLRRPYIYIYTNSSETEEQGIINVSSVRIDYNPAIEIMIKRQHVFSLYTNNNAYVLQANTKNDMIDWMKSIDKLYSMN